MHDATKPLLVFDLGAVLIDWDPRYLYRKLFDDPAEMEHFLAEICSPAWNVQQDAGRPFSVAVEALVSDYPEHRDMIEAYFERWQEMLGDAIDGSVDILKSVKGLGFQVAALTNWSAETFPLAQKRYTFLEWFDNIVVSGEEKVAKPDPEIYRILLKRTGRSAENCIFIDDSPANVDAARKLGFAAIHFRSAEQLRRELVTQHAALAALRL